jgi:DNA-binding HxlR family transcriptional regulator
MRGKKTMAEEQSPCEGPGCGAYLAFEVVGSELKLTVLHGLLSGPKRFNELRLATGMCQSSLAKTLKELEEVGIAERKVHLDRPVAVEYRLSPKGLDLFEAIRDLERWAARWVMNSGPREVTQ